MNTENTENTELDEQPKIKYLGKISPKTLGFSQDVLTKLVIDKPEGEGDYLYMITGNVSDIKTGEEKNTGPWTKFLGNIAATNIHGDIVRSGELFLPSQITPILVDYVAKGKSEEEFTGVEFEFEIGVVKRLGKGMPYNFTCKNMAKNVIESDPMAQKLLGLMNQKTLALP